MELNSDKDFYIVDITNKEKNPEPQNLKKTSISSYLRRLKIMRLWRYTRRTLALFIALVIAWGFYTKPTDSMWTNEYWFGGTTTVGVVGGLFAILAAQKKESAKLFLVAAAMLYALFNIYPPLAKLVEDVFLTLNQYLP
ncbi:hypothetical protein [Archaeoglobus neptunius]|uniref:hypothetical protein n=1 Tax=Archaeoglobus neptunius TaxID=2798580 RepID=UPI0019268478|nr:hypothetical protein [Archaeoglobus neptunius]